MNIRFLVSAVVLAVLIGVVLGPAQTRFADAEIGARAVAKTACSCIFIAGRDLEACRADDPPGFGLVRASVDEEARAVRASVFWIIRARATYRGAEGCVMD